MIEKKHHPFYTVLLIDETSFDDIRMRLEKLDLLWKYLMKDEHNEEIIVLGSTALKKEGNQF